MKQTNNIIWIKVLFYGTCLFITDRTLFNNISKQYSDKIAKILSTYLAFNFFCCPPEAFKTPDYNNS